MDKYAGEGILAMRDFVLSTDGLAKNRRWQKRMRQRLRSGAARQTTSRRHSG
jgi:hypothetical protein